MTVHIIKAIDRTLGKLLAGILGMFCRRSSLGESKKILFIQLWSVGESILTLPAIKSLMKKHPDGEYAIVCTKQNEEVFKAARLHLVEIIPVSRFLLGTLFTHYRKFDLAIDFEEFLNVSALLAFFLGKKRVGFSHGTRKKLYNASIPYQDKQHVTQTFLDLVRLVGGDCTSCTIPSLQYTLEQKQHAENFLVRDKKNLVLVPGAGDSAKSRIWPHFKELIPLLKKHHVIVVGSPNERKDIEQLLEDVVHPNLVNAAGLLSLPELFAMVEMTDIVVSNDTGPVHIASAQGTPTIALFGPNTPVRFGPLAKGSASIYHKKSCEFSPCINVHKGKVPDCLYAKKSDDYQKCMKSISIKSVLVALNSALEKDGKEEPVE